MNEVLAEQRPVEAATPGKAIAKSTLHLGIGQFIMFPVAILLNAVVGRTLGPSDYGVLGLASTVCGFAITVVDWGQTMYVVREVATFPEKTSRILGSILALRVGFTALICALVGLILRILGYPGMIQLYSALLIVMNLPFLLASAYSFMFRSRERMDYVASIDVSNRLFTAGLTIPALLMGGRILSVILFQGLAGLGALAVAVFLYQRHRLPRPRMDAASAKALVLGGPPFLAMSLGIALLPPINATILTKLAPAQVMGWYNAAWVVMSFLTAPAVIMGQAAYPRLSRASAGGQQEAFGRELRTALRPLLILGGLGAAGTYIFAELAVRVVYGRAGYAPTIPVLQLFAPGMLLIYTDMLLGGAILASGKSRPFSMVKILSVLVASVLDLVLVRYCQTRFGNGGLGVVTAYCLSELVMIAGALVLIPRGALSRSSVLDFGRAVLAAVVTAVAIKALPGIGLWGKLPIAIGFFGLVAFVVGLVRARDVTLFLDIVLRRDRPPAAPGQV